MILELILIIASILVFLLIIFVLFWQLYFLRNPKRTAPKGNNLVSPADGKIAFIKEFSELNKLVHKKHKNKVTTLLSDVAKSGYAILIVMTPFDVHYQRAPIKGAVKNIKYSKGSFLNAVKNPEKFDTIQNEKNEILFKSEIGSVKVVQIAGVLARRINCFVKQQQTVNKGKLIGLINLGSQVLLVFPKKKNLKIKVKKNQRVMSGETVIAKY
ncbi:phosphatidylserine decarboxylase family protein [Candidatus Woesearchaeota archaeon]|jgi:phosphatidylserine decarboxylase|nr:phosphatidylserine decarboxylase family protein [Candidatus Woesearchaeota archaeon]MBT6520335.1 phosphatidylserine decarboxylase family protein [Candidatus Woesearchaeota archaeon]MBT7368288.1 phosphatidylserine decarboxylase family protein [Candidatus Woesearchaeota archaeon]